MRLGLSYLPVLFTFFFIDIYLKLEKFRDSGSTSDNHGCLVSGQEFVPQPSDEVMHPESCIQSPGRCSPITEDGVGSIDARLSTVQNWDTLKPASSTHQNVDSSSETQAFSPSSALGKLGNSEDL